MTRTFLPHTMSALAALALVSVFASSSVSAQSNALSENVLGENVLGVASTQTLRTCINGSRVQRATRGRPKKLLSDL